MKTIEIEIRYKDKHPNALQLPSWLWAAIADVAHERGTSCHSIMKIALKQFLMEQRRFSPAVLPPEEQFPVSKKFSSKEYMNFMEWANKTFGLAWCMMNLWDWVAAAADARDTRSYRRVQFFGWRGRMGGQRDLCNDRQ